MSAMTNHSDTELLAAFVDGQLDRQQLEEVTAHLAACEECRSVIGEAVAFEREQVARRAPRRTWWAAAAVVVVAALPFAPGYMHRREIRNEVREVFEALPATAGRPVTARFSGQNSYAAPRPNMRGVADPSEEEPLAELRLKAATAKLIENTEHDRSAAALRAKAIALAMNGRLTEARDTILHIPAHARDAAIWNDIAAAHYAVAQRELNPAEYQLALAAAREGIQRNPKMPEALFNFALIQERIGPSAAAVEAWRRYLTADPDSPWAEEAKKHIADLTTKTTPGI